jgi:hypothetical protein
VASASRWKTWAPPEEFECSDPHPATKPSKPPKPKTGRARGGFKGFDGSTEAVAGPTVPVIAPHPADAGNPQGIRTVEVQLGSTRSRVTVVQHGCSGFNRFGQHALKFPFALVNMPAWRDAVFDLRIARWYPTQAEALRFATGLVEAPAAHLKEPERCAAEFPRNVRVELRRESPSRWSMYASNGGRANKRKDFASPFLEHAKRTAELWYGEPIDGWKEEC